MSDYKKIVAQSFSSSREFWKNIYNSDKKGVDRCYSYDMINRKSAVFEMLEKYADKNLSILDVGCGPGIFITEALHRGYQVWGIDSAELMIQEAKKSFGSYNGKFVPLVQADLEKLPIRDAKFDVVLCIGVLPYLSTDIKGITELKRVTKNGGHIIIALPNWLRLPMLFDPYYYLNRIFVLAFEKLFRTKKQILGTSRLTGYRRYFAWRLKNLFGNFNLKILEIKSIGFGPPTFWKKEIISSETAIKISQILERLSRKKLFHFLKLFTNHWVICLQKIQD